MNIICKCCEKPWDGFCYECSKPLESSSEPACYAHTCEKACEANAYQVAIRYFRSKLLECANELEKAAEDVEHWGAYADGYFQDKWDLKGDIERIKNKANEYKGAATDGA